MIKAKFIARSVYVGVSLLLLCGAVIGGIATRTYYTARIKQLLSGDAGLIRTILVDKYTSELDLDPQERTAVEQLVRKVQIRLAEFREQQEPAMQKVIVDAANEEKKNLSPGTQQKIDSIVKDTLERRSKSVQAQKTGEGSK